MNQRLEELARQAGLESFYVEYSPWQVEFEKFAELIVQECAMLVEGFTIEQEVALDDYQEYEASAVLKQHFGVEQ